MKPWRERRARYFVCSCGRRAVTLRYDRAVGQKCGVCRKQNVDENQTTLFEVLTQ